MNKRLPCTRCPGGATLKHPNGAQEFYRIGVMPSAFRTPGAKFRYDCSCGTKNDIGKGQFFAIPDEAQGDPEKADTSSLP